MSAPVVIVGSGLAGYTVAREFRRLDRQTPLVVISRDHGGFYSKPMLSNALASNKTAASLVMKPVQKMAEELAADIRCHSGVKHLDTASRTLTLDNGDTLAWRDLVLALGADPIAPNLPGSAGGEVLSVNDLDDYARFSERLSGRDRVVILGGGLIGCEFANDLLSRGVTPVVLDPGMGPLSRLLPPQASAWMRDKLRAAGVQFEWGVTATAVDRAAGSEHLEVTLSDGRTLSAGLVLSAIGLRPRVDVARAAGLNVQRGIVTDAHLATSAEHVYAVGDCAEVVGHSLPYVLPLMSQGRALAATLAGTRTPVVYPAMAVTVKTPACPTVVCPPPLATPGVWEERVGEEGFEARCLDTDGSLLGFALLGSATAQKQALVAQVRPWLT
ncbi:MAG: FAD-dependent oxidoreductase [Pseudomonadota bacterium]